MAGLDPQHLNRPGRRARDLPEAMHIHDVDRLANVASAYLERKREVSVIKRASAADPRRPD